MKVVVAGVSSAVLAGALVFAYASRGKGDAINQRVAELQEQWAAEKANLENELHAAKRRPVVIQSSAAESEPALVHDPAEPAEILETLKTLRANSRDPRSIRKVIYHLERLREIGPEALPSIRTFLARFEDVDYMGVRQESGGRQAEQTTENRDRRNGRSGDDFRERMREFRDGGRGDSRLTFVTPPSLRMGLFDVVQGIGGPAAEEILAEIMAETGRAVELAYISNLLEESAPRKYALTAIAAAKDLLLDPPQLSGGGNRLDDNSKDYLYALLLKLGDRSFAADAQSMLITQNGQMDRRALDYLDEAMKDQAMPAIYAAFNDPRLTNQMDKAALMNIALKHTGLNQQANEMLNSVVGNESTPTALRAMAVASLTRNDPTPDEIRARLPVVEALRGSTTDERMQRALTATYQNLQNMLEGKPADNNIMREVFRGGARGGADGAGFRGPGGRGSQRTGNRE